MNPRTDEEIIAALQEAEVPEPSPLFWDHLSQRVREAVAVEPVPTPGWTSRFRFAWAAGVVAAMAVVLAVTMTTRQTPQTLGPAPASVAGNGNVASVSNVLPPLEPLEPLEEDPSWSVIADLTSQMDWDEAGAAGLVVVPGAAEGAFSQLSRDEQRAVIEILQQEMKNSKRL